MSVDRSRLPAELVAARSWCAWRLEDKDGKPTKVPYGRGGRKANVQTANPGLSFAEAAAVAERIGGGVGFCFFGTPYVGLDFDSAVNGNGEPRDWAAPVLEVARAAGLYIERSPSRTGFHAIGRDGKGRTPHRRAPRKPGSTDDEKLERFIHQGFFTVTGDVVGEPVATVGPGAEVVAAAEELGRQWGEQQATATKDHVPPVSAGELPTAKLEALIANDEQFAASWSGKRADHPEWSASEYDLSVVRRAAEVGWTDEELASLVYARRERCGDDLKKARRQHR